MFCFMSVTAMMAEMVVESCQDVRIGIIFVGYKLGRGIVLLKRVGLGGMEVGGQVGSREGMESLHSMGPGMKSPLNFL